MSDHRFPMVIPLDVIARTSSFLRAAARGSHSRTSKCREARVHGAVRHAARLAVVTSVNLTTVAIGQSPCSGIHVQILNVRNSAGTVACALFESPAGFPIDYLSHATNIVVIKIREAQATCDFLNVPPGTYALAVIHDENMNGKLDTNWRRIPKEGYGFSNDATALFGAPSFSAASFQYDGQDLELNIDLQY